MKHNHLADDEIAAFLQNHSNGAEKPIETLQCAVCDDAFLKSALIFSTIREQTEVAPTNSLWTKIEHQHALNLQKKKNKINSWAFASIAASLILVVGVQWGMINQDISIQNGIQAAILQSQQLEKQIASKQEFKKASFTSDDGYANELAEIDEALQSAYRENMSQTFILDLWNRRIELLKKLESASNLQNNIEII